MYKILLPFVFFIITNCSLSQKAPINWYLKHPIKDKVFGVGADEAYKLLNGRTPKEVIVAVIDSGVETDHPDLKEVIWINSDEIPENGIDDDKNGYVDDVHGWSFLGGHGGDIDGEAMEIARMFQKENKYFLGKDISTIAESDKARYDRFLQIKKDYNKEQSELIDQYQGIEVVVKYITNVKKQQGEFSKKANKNYQTSDEKELKIKKGLKTALIFYTARNLEQQIEEADKQIGGLIRNNLSNVDSIRILMVGDNPDNLLEKYYGCNRYEGPDAMHGTHVSGIIAAKNDNGIGINGIAKNAKIMVLRAVPNGDERDKDIANAIYYAVDNGAKIINMSFGKYYTPSKEIIDEAIIYAKSKDVLFVHAAGNDAKDKNIEDSYPTRILNDRTIAANWLEVGASSVSKKGRRLIADFSNYGSKTVDLFAPGVDIYSTVPDSKYEDASGTSMASPAAAGVAAIIRGYFPELSAEEVRNVLMKTVTKTNKKIRIPGLSGGKAKGQMNDVCIASGFINAESAVRFLLDIEVKKQ
ncbi:MAG: hypothetical protein RLZ10_389 [Bacteroidota bacterium]|jgi:subtilisin family serine protease